MPPMCPYTLQAVRDYFRSYRGRKRSSHTDDTTTDEDEGYAASDDAQDEEAEAKPKVRRTSRRKAATTSVPPEAEDDMEVAAAANPEASCPMQEAPVGLADSSASAAAVATGSKATTAEQDHTSSLPVCTGPASKVSTASEAKPSGSKPAVVIKTEEAPVLIRPQVSPGPSMRRAIRVAASAAITTGQGSGPTSSSSQAAPPQSKAYSGRAMSAATAQALHVPPPALKVVPASAPNSVCSSPYSNAHIKLERGPIYHIAPQPLRSASTVRAQACKGPPAIHTGQPLRTGLSAPGSLTLQTNSGAACSSASAATFAEKQAVTSGLAYQHNKPLEMVPGLQHGSASMGALLKQPQWHMDARSPHRLQPMPAPKPLQHGAAAAPSGDRQVSHNTHEQPSPFSKLLHQIGSRYGFNQDHAPPSADAASLNWFNQLMAAAGPLSSAGPGLSNAAPAAARMGPSNMQPPFSGPVAWRAPGSPAGGLQGADTHDWNDLPNIDSTETGLLDDEPIANLLLTSMSGPAASKGQPHAQMDQALLHGQALAAAFNTIPFPSAEEQVSMEMEMALGVQSSWGMEPVGGMMREPAGGHAFFG